MRSEPKDGDQGLTLMELVVSIGIGTMVILAVLTLQNDTLKLSGSLNAALGMQEDARRSLRTMSTEIRTATAAENGSYPIATASSQELAFYADADQDGETERIRYFLDGDRLSRGLIEPIGVPASYDPNEETVIDLASGTDSVIFSYYDENYNGTSPSLSEPFDLAEIRLIKMTITIDGNGDRPPGPQTYETQVSIRNLKDNL